MYRARTQAAALDRARWLDELDEAVGQAQRLTWRLGVQEGDSEEARALYARLEAIKLELDSLRYGDWKEVRSELEPQWLELFLGAANALREARAD